MSGIYMNYAFLTPLDKEVLEEMRPFLEWKVRARQMSKAVELARERVSALLRCAPDEIVFVPGRGVANCLVILSALKNRAWKGRHIIVSRIEDPSVLKFSGFLRRERYEVSYVSVDKDGRILLEELSALIREDTVLVVVSLASPDIGTLQPIREVSKLAEKNGALLLVNSTPGLCWLDIDIRELGASFAVVSSSNIYGPPGMGAIYVSGGVDFELPAFSEIEFEAPALIAGFGKAAEVLLRERESEIERVRELRDFLELEIRKNVNGVFFGGYRASRLPNVLSICVNYAEGEAIIEVLREEGIEVGKGRESVLIALGLPPELARGSVVFSLGRWTTRQDVEKVVELFPHVVERVRRIST